MAPKAVDIDREFLRTWTPNRRLDTIQAPELIIVNVRAYFKVSKLNLYLCIM